MGSPSEAAVVFVGVGSNIEPEENIAAALKMLMGETAVRRSSKFYRTGALGRPDQPDFINGVWQIETSLSPRQMKHDVLRRIENNLGRDRTEDRFAPRAIDLDLLLYNDMVEESDELVLPHPDLKRPFVYVPTLELLDQMCDEARGPLATKMKTLLPSKRPCTEPGEALERFTRHLRQILQRSVA